MQRNTMKGRGRGFLHNIASNWQMYVLLFPFMFFFFSFHGLAGNCLHFCQFYRVQCTGGAPLCGA